MDRDNIDAISEALSELMNEYQNTIEQYTTNQLTMYTAEPEYWKANQNKDLKGFKEALNKLTEQFSIRLNKPIKTAFTEVYKDAKESLDEVKDGKFEPTEKEKVMKAFKTKVMVDITNINKSVLKGFRKMVDSVGKEIYQKKIFSGDELFKVIDDAMQTGIEDMFIITKKGRKMTFKAYQEMNVRTTLHKEALDYQYESAKEFGVVFYLCSYHSDCADDHKDYQGKIYYDENWKTIADKKYHDLIRKIITDKKCLPLQKHRDGKPWITTRPNCRHNFKPITISQASDNSAGALLNKFGMRKGTYDSKNYKDLQYQRGYERQIRKFKQQRDNLEIEIKNAPDDKTRAALRKKATLTTSKIRKNQRELNQLIKNNDVLKRDYRRENYKAIVQDVGVKYNRDKK
jgi:hypothetical protein